MTKETLRTALDRLTSDERELVCAVVATAGLTNTGTVDDLAAAADAADELGAWFHVDGAYGAAALCSTTRRHLFAGIDRADSLTIDPHKWLFAPYDSAAIIYRRPHLAKRTFTQHAGYLDVLTDREDWSPSDYAPHLTRRARGLPTWFSLAVYGTDAYRDAIDVTIATTEAATQLIRDLPHLRARHRARAVGGGVPAARLDQGPVLGVERAAPQRSGGLRGADRVARRDRPAHLHHQPPHDARRRAGLPTRLTSDQAVGDGRGGRGAQGGDRAAQRLLLELGRHLAALDDAPVGERPDDGGDGGVEVEVRADLARAAAPA